MRALGETWRDFLGVLFVAVVLSVSASAQSRGNSGARGDSQGRDGTRRADTNRPISRVVVFGDSLSDNGNYDRATGGIGAPYWQGRWSNGPVALEYLARDLNVPLVDLAWAGATTGVGNFADAGAVDALGTLGLPGMTSSLNEFVTGSFVDPDALYVVWGGPNDLWYAADDASASAAIEGAVARLTRIVTALQRRGAKRIVVSNTIDLGSLPWVSVRGRNVAAFFTSVSVWFNRRLEASLPPGVQYFDMFSHFSDIRDRPAAYGLRNVTTPCFTGDSLCAAPQRYFFFDDMHPTTAVHAILGNALYQSVAPAEFRRTAWP